MRDCRYHDITRLPIEDVLILEEGERVRADARLIDASGMWVDNAAFWSSPLYRQATTVTFPGIIVTRFLHRPDTGQDPREPSPSRCKQ